MPLESADPLVLPPVGIEIRARGWTSRWPPATRPTRIALAPLPADLHIETKPDRSFVTQADTAIERRHPGAHRGRASRTTAWSARSTARRTGAGRPALVHRPHRRHPQLHARRAAVRDAPGARGRRGPGARRASARRRCGTRWFAWRGGGAWATRAGPGGLGPSTRAPVRSRPGVSRLEDAQLLYSSVPELVRLGPGARLRGAHCARSGAIAASATSGAMRWSPRGRRRRWSRSAAQLGPGRPLPCSSRRPAAG